MASLPPEPILPLADAPGKSAPLPGDLAERWDALHRQAAQLGSLAGIAPEARQTDFAALVTLASAWQRELAARGLEDIAAMLEPGLDALAILTARGQDTVAPALALWREFQAARASVLALFQPAMTD